MLLFNSHPSGEQKEGLLTVLSDQAGIWLHLWEVGKPGHLAPVPRPLFLPDFRSGNTSHMYSGEGIA